MDFVCFVRKIRLLHRSHCAGRYDAKMGLTLVIIEAQIDHNGRVRSVQVGGRVNLKFLLYKDDI